MDFRSPLKEETTAPTARTEGGSDALRADPSSRASSVSSSSARPSGGNEKTNSAVLRGSSDHGLQSTSASSPAAPARTSPRCWRTPPGRVRRATATRSLFETRAPTPRSPAADRRSRRRNRPPGCPGGGAGRASAHSSPAAPDNRPSESPRAAFSSTTPAVSGMSKHSNATNVPQRRPCASTEVRNQPAPPRSASVGTAVAGRQPAARHGATRPPSSRAGPPARGPARSTPRRGG